MSVFTFCYIIFLQVAIAAMIIIGFIHEDEVIEFEQRLWKKLKKHFGGTKNETV